MPSCFFFWHIDAFMVVPCKLGALECTAQASSQIVAFFFEFFLDWTSDPFASEFKFSLQQWLSNVRLKLLASVMFV